MYIRKNGDNCWSIVAEDAKNDWVCKVIIFKNEMDIFFCPLKMGERSHLGKDKRLIEGKGNHT